MCLAWPTVPSHSSRARLERRNLVHQMRADNQTSESECSVFVLSLGCSPISLLIGFPLAAMKIMMFTVEQWTGQTHVHCRRHIPDYLFYPQAVNAITLATGQTGHLSRSLGRRELMAYCAGRSAATCRFSRMLDDPALRSMAMSCRARI